MIRKEDGEYFVYSEKGKRMGGPYKSKKKAEERLQQIEFFKHKGKSESMNNFDRTLNILNEDNKWKDEGIGAVVNRTKDKPKPGWYVIDYEEGTILAGPFDTSPLAHKKMDEFCSKSSKRRCEDTQVVKL